MHSRAEKIYKVYRSAAARRFKSVPRYELNALYNAECKIKKDSDYAREMSEFKTAEGEPIEILIQKYFYDYNNLYGLEIRDDLLEYEDPEMASGSFFTIESYRMGSDGALTEKAPTEFSVGEVAHVRATLLSHATLSPLSSKMLTARIVTDDGEAYEKTVMDTASIEFDITLSRPGSAKFKITPLDEKGDAVLGAEVAFGGIIFAREEISTTHRPPCDLLEFWEHEVERLLKTNPCEIFPDGYSGKVKSNFDITAENKYALIKVDGEYAKRLSDIGQPAPTDEDLSKFDIYEVNLKSPGPCPATAYVSVPKGAEPKSLPVHFIFDGYGVKMPTIVCEDAQISVHCSHHGYKLAKSAEYYKRIWDTVAHSYCRGNGEVNSDFADIHDSYPLYLLLRNLQTLRFLTDSSLSADISNLHTVWNGDVTVFGGSMGGFQTVGLGALGSILKRKTGNFNITSLSALSPAFGNVAGSTDRRVASTFFLYKDGADYFDTAILATMLDAPCDIPRASLGDEVCPITTITAIYNSIPESVRGEIRYIQNSSHGYLPDEEYQKWIVYKG